MMNLLSYEEKTAIRHEHTWRFFEVCCFVIVVLLVLAVVMLLPSFIYLRAAHESAQNALQNAQAERALLERDTATIALVKSVKGELELLAPADPPLPEVAPLVEALLAKRTPGTTIEAITFTRSTVAPAGPRATLDISGTAKDRPSLLGLIGSLESEPLFSRVDSPITNLVKDKDIQYIIHLDVK